MPKPQDAFRFETHALVQAARAGDIKRVRECLSLPNRIARRFRINRAGRRHLLALALQVAIEPGHHLGIVRCLLAAGADVNAGQGYALQLAARNGHLEIVQSLLDAGADVQAYNNVALNWAARIGHLDVVACLLDAGAEGDPETLCWAAVWAAQPGGQALVRRLLDADDTVLAPGGHALRMSAAWGHASAVQVLRAHGADVRPVLGALHSYPRKSQVALLSGGEVHTLSVRDLARRGVCTEALCVLLERQGHADLAAMLGATQMLDPLEPVERATLLSELQSQYTQAEAVHDPA